MSVMAHIAFIFHWSADDMWDMSIDELYEWHDHAMRIHKQANSTK